MNDELSYGFPKIVSDKLKAVFKTYSDIERVILYDSRAKGNYKPGSDIDLCIEANVLELSDLLKIQNEIDDLLLPWLVDISFKHHIDNQHLLEHIDRVGKMFYMQCSK